MLVPDADRAMNTRSDACHRERDLDLPGSRRPTSEALHNERAKRWREIAAQIGPRSDFSTLRFARSRWHFALGAGDRRFQLGNSWKTMRFALVKHQPPASAVHGAAGFALGASGH